MIVQNGHSNVLSPCKHLYIKRNFEVLIWRYIALIYHSQACVLIILLFYCIFKIKRVDVSMCFANISLINHLDKTIESCLTTYYAILVFFLLKVIMSVGTI